MKLLTKELERALPPLGSQAENDNPTIRAKFFTPDSNWTWYVIEGEFSEDHNGWLFFGLVDGLEREFGYFTLGQLQEVRGKLGLPVERDRYWTPKPVSEVQAKAGAR